MKFNTILQQPNLGLLFLRISIGGLMLTHGVNKITKGVNGMKGMLSAKGFPEIMAYGAFTMVIAIYVSNGDNVLAFDERGSLKIELALMYLLGSLTLVFSGSGRFGVRKGLGPWD